RAGGAFGPSARPERAGPALGLEPRPERGLCGRTRPGGIALAETELRLLDGVRGRELGMLGADRVEELPRAARRLAARPRAPDLERELDRRGAVAALLGELGQRHSGAGPGVASRREQRTRGLERGARAVDVAGGAAELAAEQHRTRPPDAVVRGH